MLKQKERLAFRRDKIRKLYIYRHLTLQDITDHINGDPETVNKCGKTSRATVAYDLKKIKKEMENMVDGDGLDRYTAEFMRSCEFQDGEISDITKILATNTDLSMKDKIALMQLRHRIEIDKMTLLSDREIPLTVKKLKKDRAELVDRLNVIKPDEEITSITNLEKFPNRVRPKVVDNNG